MSDENEVRRGMKAVAAEWLRSEVTQRDLLTMLEANEQAPMIEILSDGLSRRLLEFLEESHA